MLCQLGKETTCDAFSGFQNEEFMSIYLLFSSLFGFKRILETKYADDMASSSMKFTAYKNELAKSFSAILFVHKDISLLSIN